MMAVQAWKLFDPMLTWGSSVKQLKKGDWYVCISDMRKST